MADSNVLETVMKLLTDAGYIVTKSESSKEPPLNKGRPVLVTTAHRGVFFGYSEDTTGDVIALNNARNCVYWDVGTKGFLGLASSGPTSKCRVGPAANIVLKNITSVTEVTEKAVAAWEKEPWA